MLIGLKEGFDTPIFALAFIVSLIIAYDGMGVRLETEKQAKAINELGKLKKLNFKLKDKLGHQPVEIMMGYILGTIMAFIYSFV